MEIKILGRGCPRCHEVEKRTADALAELNVEADIQKISDFREMARFKIITTPALVINDKLRCSGRIPSVNEIKDWIQEEL